MKNIRIEGNTNGITREEAKIYLDELKAKMEKADKEGKKP